MDSITAVVKDSFEIARDLRGLALELEESSALEAMPGQFAHIKVPGDSGRLLRRPISIYSIKDNILYLAIQPKGEGTHRICSAQKGSGLDMIFPLGNGFSAEGAKNIWLVGGGVGVAPLRFCAERFPVSRAIFGYRTAAHVYGAAECAETGSKVTVCTDDGSAGEHGLVTKPLIRLLEEGLPDLIMTCGPTPMLREVSRIAAESGIPTRLSLEQRMGCGVGACLTCSCEANGGGYLRVCTDGPVFDAKAVAL